MQVTRSKAVLIATLVMATIGLVLTVSPTRCKKRLFPMRQTRLKKPYWTEITASPLSGRITMSVFFSVPLQVTYEEIEDAGTLCWYALTYESSWSSKVSLSPVPVIIGCDVVSEGHGLIVWTLLVNDLNNTEADELRSAKHAFEEVMTSWCSGEVVRDTAGK